MPLPDLHAGAIGAILKTIEPAELELLAHLGAELKPIAAEAIEGEAAILGGAIDRLLPFPMAVESLKSLGGKLIAIAHLRDAPASPPPADPVAKPGA
jgi:hypothetical protein